MRSIVIDQAEARSAALSAVTPALDLGTTLPLAGFKDRVTEARALQARYNQVLAEAQELRVALVREEKEVAALSARMLAGVGAVYGKHSAIYAAAGGTPSDQRKRRYRKAASGATDTA